MADRRTMIISHLDPYNNFDNFGDSEVQWVKKLHNDVVLIVCTVLIQVIRSFLECFDESSGRNSSGWRCTKFILEDWQKQRNSTDCGVFILKMAENLSQNNGLEDVCPLIMGDYRDFIHDSILVGHL